MKRISTYVAFIGVLTIAAAFAGRAEGRTRKSCIVTITGNISFPTDDCDIWKDDPDVISCVCAPEPRPGGGIRFRRSPGA